MEFKHRFWSSVTSHGVAICVVALLAASLVQPAQGADEPAKVVSARFDTKHGEVETVAEVEVEYDDGSMLLLASDGQLWTVESKDMLDVQAETEPMQPATSEEVYERFRKQLPPGFSVHKTKHYVLVYDTSKAYVTWVGQLFESIHRGFANYWKSRGLRLDEPRFPLVAVVFSNKQSYLKYAQAEIGESAKAMIGYYNMKTNRMVMYDLTGVDGNVPAGHWGPSSAVVRRVLAQPNAERTVATIVHEAVHQLAYNMGLQVRLADNPYWVSEGMAMFFESPDPNSAVGWGGIGKVNYHNLNLFRRGIPGRPADKLSSMITDDTKFQQAGTAAQYYPESWALMYFLMKTKGRALVAYLKELKLLEPLSESTPSERMEVFKKHFGDPEKLELAFMRYMRRLR